MTSGPLPIPFILLVEDNPGDQFLTRKALMDSGVPHVMRVVEDGDDALDFVFRRGIHTAAARPDLILLDLNLPKVSGFEVLGLVKDDPGLRSIAIIVLTSSEAERDLVGSYSRHANAYMVKPGSPKQFNAAITSLGQFWFQHNRLPTR